MRSDAPDFDRGFEPGLDRDLDTELRLFFRRAARPAVPESLDRAIEDLPERRLRDRFGLPGRQLLARPMKGAFVALSVLLAIALTAGLLNLRGLHYATPGNRAPQTRVPLTDVSRNPDITAMGRFDSNTGWVEIDALDPDDTGRSSSYLRWTEDGGKTWSERRPVPLPLTQTAMGSVQFVDSSHGWTLSQGPESAGGLYRQTLWRTSDGGRTWLATAMPFDPVTLSNLGQLSVHFRDALHGEAFEFHGPITTGATPAAGTLYDFCRQSSTSDGGATWSQLKAITCMAEITFVDPMFGYADDYSGEPVVYITLDGGQTWTAGTLPERSTWGYTPMLMERRSDGTLQALYFWMTDGTGYWSIVASHDSGRTWTTVGMPSTDKQTADRYGLPMGLPRAVMDESHWISGTWSYDDKATVLFESSDGGLTWRQFAYTGLSGDVSKFDFLNASDGWAATNTTDKVAALWSTRDGGATWTRILTTP